MFRVPLAVNAGARERRAAVESSYSYTRHVHFQHHTTATTDTMDESLEIEKAVLQEGDNAKRIHFETLISLKTAQPLGSIGAAQLVPWVPPFLHEYLVVLADPRPLSSDLRRTIQYLVSSKNSSMREILSNVVVISADPIVETAK